MPRKNVSKLINNFAGFPLACAVISAKLAIIYKLGFPVSRFLYQL